MTKQKTAKRDGVTLGKVARDRLTPAHNALSAVFDGLKEVHGPFHAHEFERAFYKAVAGRQK